ncbi:MAG: hypothetical protein AAF602_00080 [Myxococcota bacterium]
MIMIFESLTPTTHADCGKGVWALGMATSTDGENWTIESTEVVLPNPGGAGGVPYACVAAHPSAVFTTAGANGKVQVYWKAETYNLSGGAAACSAPDDFCEYTGIGRATINLNASGGLNNVSIQTSSVVDFPQGRYGGYPRIVQVDSTFYLTVQLYPDIHTFYSTSASTFPLGNSNLAFDADSSDWDTFGWVTDEFMSPAMICDDELPDEWALWLGSKDTNFGVTQSGGIGRATSDDFSTWFLSGTASHTWSGDDTMRHFDAIKLDTDEYLLYYSEKDTNGESTIHLLATDQNFDLSTDTPVGKVCTGN